MGCHSTCKMDCPERSAHEVMFSRLYCRHNPSLSQLQLRGRPRRRHEAAEQPLYVTLFFVFGTLSAAAENPSKSGRVLVPVKPSCEGCRALVTAPRKLQVT
ncbi:hypothetical protein B0H12DRAFT_1130839 [Mycena haematopus]|nr:hypothetical protein B0H12DRAFT_1130839 [Mycena haematopus]